MPITLICTTDHSKHITFPHEPDAEKFTRLSKWQLQRRIRGKPQENEIHIDGETYVPIYGDIPYTKITPEEDWL